MKKQWKKHLLDYRFHETEETIELDHTILKSESKPLIAGFIITS